jgi:hypothetical protein
MGIAARMPAAPGFGAGGTAPPPAAALGFAGGGVAVLPASPLEVVVGFEMLAWPATEGLETFPFTGVRTVALLPALPAGLLSSDEQPPIVTISAIQHDIERLRRRRWIGMAVPPRTAQHGSVAMPRITRREERELADAKVAGQDHYRFATWWHRAFVRRKAAVCFAAFGLAVCRGIQSLDCKGNHAGARSSCECLD